MPASSRSAQLVKNFSPSQKPAAQHAQFLRQRRIEALESGSCAGQAGWREDREGSGEDARTGRAASKRHVSRRGRCSVLSAQKCVTVVTAVSEDTLSRTPVPYRAKLADSAEGAWHGSQQSGSARVPGGETPPRP